MAANRILGWIGGLGLAMTASGQQVQVLSAEPVEIAAYPGTARFDAYGRRFQLSLQPNERLLQSLKQRSPALGTRLLRGNLEGMPGSWVRLSRVGGGLEGAIWDGHELYVVTRYRQIAGSPGLKLGVPPSHTVLFRLSDVVDASSQPFCGSDPPLERSARQANATGDALERFHRVVADASSSLAADGMPQLDIELVADTDFVTRLGADATDEILARLNIVDGIFAEQVGVLLAPAEITLLSGSADPFTTNDPQDLLEELAGYRASATSVESGVTHLMTGKFLAEGILGIARTGTLCDPGQSVSLTSSADSTFLSALVMAHELGHNFGAPHDGVPGACASTPQTYLMQPALSRSSRFSPCSLAAMSPIITSARNVCLAPASYADVSLELPASPYTVDTRGTFTLPVTVHSGGNLAATGVTFELDVPAALAVDSAGMSGGTCALSGDVLACTLGDIAPGQQRGLQVQLTGTTLGPFDLQGRVGAGNDRVASNNSGSVRVGLQADADLGLAVDVTPMNPVYVGDELEIAMDVLSRSSQATPGLTLQLDLAGIPIESFDAGAHACSIEMSNPWLLECQLADVPANSSTRISVRARPGVAGNYQATFALDGAGSGTPFRYDAATFIEVTPEAQVHTGASPDSLDARIGAEYEITYTLNAAGRRPATDIEFHLDPPSNGIIESLSAGGRTCDLGAPATTATCVIGTLNPGESRDVRARVRMVSGGASVLTGRTRYLDGTSVDETQADVSITTRMRVDASVVMNGPLTGARGQNLTAVFTFQSEGVEPAQNVVLTLEVPAPARLAGFSLLTFGQPFLCSSTLQRLRCSGSFTALQGGTPTIGISGTVTVVSDSDLEGEITATVSADADENSANDVSATTLRVEGQLVLTDLRLSIGATSVSAARGARLNYPLITVTNGDAIANNVLVEITLPDFVTVETVSSSGTCSGTTEFQCYWPTILPGEIASIDLKLLASATGSFSSSVTVIADNDASAGNNEGSVALGVTSTTAPTSDPKKKGGGALEHLTLIVMARVLARRLQRGIGASSA